MKKSLLTISIMAMYLLVPSTANAADRWGTVELDRWQAKVVRAIRKEWRPEGRSTVRRALIVAWCESGFRTTARNASGAYGVFQLMPFWHHSMQYGHTPTTQARGALRLYRSSRRTFGGPWLASIHCWGR